MVSHFEPKKDWFLTHGREGRGVGWWMVARGYVFFSFLRCELKQLKYAFYFIQSALLCTFIFAPALVPSEWLAFHRNFSPSKRLDRWSESLNSYKAQLPFLLGILIPKNKSCLASMPLAYQHFSSKLFPPILTEHLLCNRHGDVSPIQDLYQLHFHPLE